MVVPEQSRTALSADDNRWPFRAARNIQEFKRSAIRLCLPVSRFTVPKNVSFAIVKSFLQACIGRISENIYVNVKHSL